MPDQDIDKGGRPTAFLHEYLHQAYIVCADDGYTNVKLAKLFNVDVRTIQNWLKTIPEFKENVMRGKDDHDSKYVEKSLLKRAKGFKYTEVTSEIMWIDDPRFYQPTPMQQLHGIERKLLNTYVPTKKVTKLVVPDTKACEVWLCNRQPERWKRIKHVEVTGAAGGPIKTQDLTSFPNEPKTIKEWEEQVRDAEKNDKETKPNEETPSS